MMNFTVVEWRREIGFFRQSLGDFGYEWAYILGSLADASGYDCYPSLTRRVTIVIPR